jgi:chromosome segregation ATPase
MIPAEETSQWIVYAAKFGIPSFVIAGLVWAAPKVWGVIQAKIGISQQQNDLTQAGLGGVNEVIQTLRNQIADMTGQLKGFEDKLKEMSATLDKAVQDKIVAQRAAEQAKSDLFTLQLYVNRLIAQIKALGASPVDQ